MLSQTTTPPILQVHTCKLCDAPKPAYEFIVIRNRVTGRCKDCVNAQVRARKPQLEGTFGGYSDWPKRKKRAA